MEKKEFLPIGTIVVLKGEAQRKAMVITRALSAKINNEMLFFDYGGTFYPMGLVGDQVLYFNEEDIAEVVHKGYVDETEIKQLELINQWLIEHDMKKGKVEDLMALKKKEFEAAAERIRNLPNPKDVFKDIKEKQENANSTNNDTK